MSFKTKASITSFGGKLLKLTHDAASTGCEMALNMYLPPAASRGKVPVLFYLSGLTCTGDNCAEKGFFQAAASQHGIAIVYPDTSPRGVPIPGDDAAYDFGTGAGFYIDATKMPWAQHFRMETYIAKELPTALFGAYGTALDDTRVAITGHSMGGHGALTLFLKYPGMYKSVSALAPICNPTRCAWGKKAFAGYLGGDEESTAKWTHHDATELVKRLQGGKFPCLIDVGTADQFYQQQQLLPENFIEAAKESGNGEGLVLRFQEGYDHSYYFIATFASDHVNHAAKYLFA